MSLHLSIGVADGLDATLADQLGRCGEDRSEPFPSGGTDLVMLNLSGTMRIGGQRQRFTFPSCIATVRRTDPFVVRSDAAVRFPPHTRRSDEADDVVRRDDFTDFPDRLFTPGREAVWLEVADLDARGNVDGGAARLLAGDSLLAEHADLHERALGVAQSLLGAGFPARLVIALRAVLVVPRGTFKLGPGAFVTAELRELAAATGFRFAGRGELFRVENLRRQRDGDCEPSGQLLTLDAERGGGTQDAYQAFAALKQRLAT